MRGSSGRKKRHYFAMLEVRVYFATNEKLIHYIDDNLVGNTIALSCILKEIKND